MVAFTGAGVSASSGIPTFEGKGGLQEQFPIDNYRFPGAVADWMIHRPRETALVLGRFYTRFMTGLSHPGSRSFRKVGATRDTETHHYGQL